MGGLRLLAYMILWYINAVLLIHGMQRIRTKGPKFKLTNFSIPKVAQTWVFIDVLTTRIDAGRYFLLKLMINCAICTAL